MEQRRHRVTRFVLAVAVVAGGAAVWRTAGGRPSRPAYDADQHGRIVVEVLNGSRAAGLARTTTRRLRAQGIDVVYFGNYTGSRGVPVDTTLVLARRGDSRAAHTVRAIMDVGSVVVEPDDRRLVDVTVILGRDLPPERAGMFVEVLNASETSGLAMATTRLLRERGYRVLHYGKHEDSLLDSTVVIVHRGDARAGRAVQSIIEVGRVLRDEVDGPFDLTVILGKDASGLIDNP